MDAAADRPDLHRMRCNIHALRRAEQRGIDLDIGSLIRLEAAIERLRRAWYTPGTPADRYWLSVVHRRQRVRVLYDAALRCVVTVMPGRPRI